MFYSFTNELSTPSYSVTLTKNLMNDIIFEYIKKNNDVSTVDPSTQKIMILRTSRVCKTLKKKPLTRCS